MAFTKAIRSKNKFKIAVSGPSGSGKTFSSLKLAQGLGKKVAVIDTENGSAALYAEEFNFDVSVLSPPFTVEKYKREIDEAIKQDYDVLVIDSITHAWAGDGGLLAQKEELDSNTRKQTNSFTNWSTITKKHESFKAAILQADIHIICTMRAKQEYILQQNQYGKQVPVKIGLAPIQRGGMEYEFSLVFELSMAHEALAAKDRSGLFDGTTHVIDEQTGITIKNWLESAKELTLTEQLITDEEKSVLSECVKLNLITSAEIISLCKKHFEKTVSQLNREEYLKFKKVIDTAISISKSLEKEQ